MKSALHDFFTLECQAELIHNAQKMDHSYEKALLEYEKVFTTKLIKCFEQDTITGVNSKLYCYVKSVLDSVNDGSSQRIIILENVPSDPKNVSLIAEMFLLIREVFHRWISCELNTSIKVLNHILDKKIDMKHIKYYTMPETSTLYRGRISDCQLEKIEFFHIPFSQLYKIRNQRFSITGQPLLYLTDRIAGVFNELSVRKKELYEKVYIAQFRLRPDKAQWFDKIFDMTINADELENADNNNEFYCYFCKFLLSCICSFPNIRGRDNSYFVEEYVIPQLVTQLLKNADFKGIRYNTINSRLHGKSSKPYNDYINYAFFTKRANNEDALDIELKERFVVDSPITVLKADDYDPAAIITLPEVIEILEKHFEKINELVSIMNQIGGSDYFQDYFEEKTYLFKDGQYRFIDLNFV